jgi:broad specificity phosphatase PhoE
LGRCGRSVDQFEEKEEKNSNKKNDETTSTTKHTVVVQLYKFETEAIKTVAMATESMLVVMRHGVRVDIKDPDASWSDKNERPYDPPITDIQLAEETAGMLREYGIDVIISSPFRRCIQTSGVMARVLGVSSIVIDFGLSEVMNSVRNTGVSSMTYLSDDDIIRELDGAASIADINRDCMPPFDEEVSGTLMRYKESLKTIAKKFAGKSVLCVTHGNAVEICGSNYMQPPMLPVEVNECGFIALRGTSLEASHGITLLNEEETW